MRLLHKKIRDINKLMEMGSSAKALKALNQHITAEHGIESQIAELTGILNAYQAELIFGRKFLGLEGTLRAMGSPEFSKARDHLKRAEYYAEQLGNLLKQLLRRKKTDLE